MINPVRTSKPCGRMHPMLVEAPTVPDTPVFDLPEDISGAVASRTKISRETLARIRIAANGMLSNRAIASKTVGQVFKLYALLAQKQIDEGSPLDLDELIDQLGDAAERASRIIEPQAAEAEALLRLSSALKPVSARKEIRGILKQHLQLMHEYLETLQEAREDLLWLREQGIVVETAATSNEVLQSIWDNEEDSVYDLSVR